MVIRFTPQRLPSPAFLYLSFFYACKISILRELVITFCSVICVIFSWQFKILNGKCLFLGELRGHLCWREPEGDLHLLGGHPLTTNQRVNSWIIPSVDSCCFYHVQTAVVFTTCKQLLYLPRVNICCIYHVQTDVVFITSNSCCI